LNVRNDMNDNDIFVFSKNQLLNMNIKK